MFHICSDSAVLEGPACALSLLHLSRVGCKWALSDTTGGSLTWRCTGCVLWREAIPKAGSKRLLWGLRVAASWSVLWGPMLCSELQSGPGNPAAPRLWGWLCACRTGVLQALLGAAPDCWQLLQHLSATAHQDFQVSFPEFPSPSLSWPTERLKNF